MTPAPVPAAVSLAPSVTYTLTSRHGWCLRYVVRPDGVTVERTYRGAPAGDLKLPLDRARGHYASQRRAGLTTPGSEL